MAKRITDQLVRNAQPGSRIQTFLWDTELKGFALRITNKGSKAFVLDYRIDGRQRRITIGNYPDWSVQAARRQASEFKKSVDRGEDPMADRHARRLAPSLLDLWRRYEQDYLPRKANRSQVDERIMWEKIILPELGQHKLVDINHSLVESFHTKITEGRGTPVRANRVIEVLRHAFNLAIRWEWCETNPASGVRKNPEEKRQKYLSPEELSQLFLALDNHTEVASANAIRFLILTGARKSEVLSATWDMFDMSRAIWIKPSAHTKQRREHRIPLSESAISLLVHIKSTSDSPYVFPGKTKEAPLTDIKRTWESVCRKSGLADQITKRDKRKQIIKSKSGAPVLVWKAKYRIHDLRHSFASILVSEGASLPVIGAMLGHTQIQTTARYAHLYDSALREAAEKVADRVGERGNR